MEAARDFIPFEDDGPGTERCTGRGTVCAADPGADHGMDPVLSSGVDGVLAALQALGSSAVQDAALFDFRAASVFADGVEDLSRYVEYLQVVAAGAVDRTRKRAAADAAKAGTSWTTGWREDSPGSAATAGTAAGGTWAAPGPGDGPGDGASPATADGVSDGGPAWVPPADAADDGYRNTAEFLRARLLIGASEARRRLALAESILPRQGFTGEPLPPVRGELGAAVAAGEVASRAATVITLALDRVRHVCDADAAARMEHALTRTAAGERRRFPGPGRAALGGRDGPGRCRALRGAAAPAPGRLHPTPAPRPAPSGDFRDHRPVRAPPDRHEHRHQPPHRQFRGAGDGHRLRRGPAAGGEASVGNDAAGVSACASQAAAATGGGVSAAAPSPENPAASGDRALRKTRRRVPALKLGF